MVVTIWKEAGFFMIFYLAALQSMSPHLAEAAAIEGASRWYFFRRVTFPLLMPTTLFVLVNAVINAFRLVDHIVVMTRGGPDNATALLLYYIYEIGFRFWDSAYAAALTMVLLALLGAASRSAQFVVPRAQDRITNEPRRCMDRERASTRRTASARALETPAHGCSALLWMLPLVYAFWTAFHPAEFSTRLRADGAADARELRQGVARGAVRALFPQHGDPRHDGARRAARAGDARRVRVRALRVSRAATCCSRWCWCS